MDFIYFAVTGSKAWEPLYHENFFVTQGGFVWGLIGALIIGALFACIFYFGCCNSKKSVKSATLSVWAVMLVISGVVTYLYADMVIIGDSKSTDNTSVFRAYSFYKANDDYFIKETSQPNVSQTVIASLTQKKNEIYDNLNKGGDVRFDFDLTTAILGMIFYFLTSMIVKRFTLAGKSIPLKKP